MLQIGDKKLINGWAFYDWANSVYSLVISTAVFPLYYSGITSDKVVSFLGIDWEHPDALYSYTLSFSFLVVAFMSPILSAIADYTGNKKQFLKIFCTIGAVSVMSLYFFESIDTIWIGIVFTFFASIGFWSSVVFYNSYLPEVAFPEDQDRVSAKGFVYGYTGSVILLVINLIMILYHDMFGITEAYASRISFVMVGLWWIGFAQITFKVLPNNTFQKKPEKDYIWKGFKELKIVWTEIKTLPTLKGFLIAFFLLSIGVQTIILLATIFGSSELGLGAISLIVTVVLIQVIAILGATIFSRISNKYGNFTALKITISIWILVCFCAFLLHKELPNVDLYFYGLGGLLGLVLGAIQSLTRSTYSKLLPKTEDHATFFSFYDVTEKIAIVLGTFVYGFLYSLTGSMQWSVLSLALFFVASFIVLSRLKKTKYVY
ncbi:MFS transporter [Polaribacter sp. HL-MS24]|uniref:MFS transporter n=1 Tax=Polaribacter sp. HL-MS24 TaxID=3077735 RepID=UPI002934EF16|nr:MFS transporter [Polaribacter sp. HL-MS24]WOC40367.1 MFS transporter [Polaribacter sp. HL-MS24]